MKTFQVREDAEKEWERIDTLSRNNPDLSIVNEDEPDGIHNTAFEMEEDETRGEVIIEKRTDASTEKTGTDTEKTQTNEEMPSNIGITRERPKTKKAVLVKTDTMEDLENGFELVTESDLEKRTESDISSGNESTGTHTISLSFSETFDDRHKDDQTTNTDNRNDKNSDNMNTNVKGENELNNGKAEISVAIAHDTFKGNETAEIDEKNESDKPLKNETNILVPEMTETEIQNRKRDLDNDNQACHTVSKEMIPSENNNKNILIEDPVKNVHAERNAKIDTDITIKDVQSENSFDVVTNEPSAFTVKVDQKGSNKIEENIAKQDNDSKIQSDPNNLYMEKQKTQENVVQDDINLLEKKKTENLEKDEDKLTEDEMGASESSLNENQHALVPTGEGKTSEDEASGKKPYINISNENIVLEAVPPTPTKFVQESFILETEATLPVYLDNIHASPVRGRRAFTLNDIVSDPILGNDGDSKGLSLPKGMDEISKSSPVLSEIQPTEIQDFEKKHFNFLPVKGDIIFTKSLSEENLNQSSSIKEEVDTVKDKVEDEEITSDASANKQAIYTFESSVQNAFDLAGDLHKSTEFENVKMLESTKNDFSELYQDKPSDPSDQIVSTQFSITTNEPFDFVSADKRQDQLLNRTENEPFTTSFKMENVDVTQDEIFSAYTKPEENLEMGSNTRNKEIGQKEELNEAKLSDNTFFNALPQSSAPIIDTFDEKSTESSQRKKVLPQTFDFNNVSVSDSSDSVKSDSSTEGENDEDIAKPENNSKEHAMSVDILESELIGQEKQKIDSIQDEINSVIQKENSSAIKDMISVTKSNESAMSWDLLGTENSHDPSKIDHNEENIPGLLEFSLNNDESNKTNAVLSLSSENTNMLDLMSEIPKQTLPNNTSVGSSGLTDTSWEILNEGDNSEC